VSVKSFDISKLNELTSGINETTVFSLKLLLKNNRLFTLLDDKFVRRFYPRDAMLARSLRQQRVRLSVRLSHAGILPSRAKAGSCNVHHLIAHDSSFWQGMSRRKIRKGSP